jgi:putative ATP-dependent endonuclease of OLD family
MHGLSYIRIKNYRACREVELPLEGFTPLVGPNNAGKSSILAAIKWVLKLGSVASSDFFDTNKPIEVCARIDGISQEIIDLLPEQKHKAAITPYCNKGHLWIRATASGTGKAFKAEVYDVENYIGTGIPEKWRDYPTGLPQAVSALLPEPLHIEAMDDIGEDLGKSKAGTTIKSLLDEIMEPILKTHEELNTAMATVKAILTKDGHNRSDHLKKFDDGATSALEPFFPGLALDLDLQIADVKEFFKVGDLHVTDNVTGDRRKFDQIGTGAQRSIQMALIRYLSEIKKANPASSARRMLLIDEPELYLHPQGVRRLRQALFELSKLGFQIVFSTHSPGMLSRDNASDTVIVGKTKDHGTTTRKPLRAAVQSALNDAESQSRTLFELGNVAEIYFSERVVLCEGKTDRRLLPLAYEQLYGVTPELDQITFVSLGACSDIPKAMPVLNAMGIKTCAIADLDFAFIDARKGYAALLPKEREDIENTKQILARLKATHGFHLGDNGLPAKDKKSSWAAADTWALWAQDDEGKVIAKNVHDELKALNIWVWPTGCIEHVTKHDGKGEDAIITQEAELRELDAESLNERMPEFKRCFDWIKTIN